MFTDTFFFNNRNHRYIMTSHNWQILDVALSKEGELEWAIQDTTDSNATQVVKPLELGVFVQDSHVKQWIQEKYQDATEGTVESLEIYLKQSMKCEVWLGESVIFNRTWGELCSLFGYFKTDKPVAVIDISDGFDHGFVMPQCPFDFDKLLDVLKQEEYGLISATIDWADFDIIISGYEVLQVDFNKLKLTEAIISNEICARMSRHFSTIDIILDCYDQCRSHLCKQALRKQVEPRFDAKEEKRQEYVVHSDKVTSIIRRSNESIQEAVAIFAKIFFNSEYNSISFALPNGSKALNKILNSLNKNDGIMFVKLLDPMMKQVMNIVDEQHFLDKEVFFGLNFLKFWRALILSFGESIRRADKFTISPKQQWHFLCVSFYISWQLGEWSQFDAERDPMPYIQVGNWESFRKLVSYTIENYVTSDPMVDMVEHMIEHFVFHGPNLEKKLSEELRIWIEWYMTQNKSLIKGSEKIVTFSRQIPVLRRFDWSLIIGDYIMYDCQYHKLICERPKLLLVFMEENARFKWDYTVKFD